MSLETISTPTRVEGDDTEPTKTESIKTEADTSNEGMKGGGGGDTKRREKVAKRKSFPSSSSSSSSSMDSDEQRIDRVDKTVNRKRPRKKDDLFFRKKTKTNDTKEGTSRGGDIPNLYGPGLPFTHCKIVLSLLDEASGGNVEGDGGGHSPEKFKTGWKRQNGEFVYYDGITPQEKERMNRKIAKAKKGESSSDSESGSESSSDSDSSDKDDGRENDEDDETEKLTSDTEEDDADTDSNNTDKKKTKDTDSDWEQNETSESSNDTDHDKPHEKKESSDEDGESYSDEEIKLDGHAASDDETTRSDTGFNQGSPNFSVTIEGSPDWDGMKTDFDVKPLLTEENNSIRDSPNDSEGDGESEPELKLEVLFKCPFCFLIYPAADKLIDHLATHNTPSQVGLEVPKEKAKDKVSPSSKNCCRILSKKCHICGKMLTSSSNRRTHMKIHNDERQFHCQECGKSFRQLSHIQAHMRIHSNEKPFQCQSCNSAFKQKAHIDRHMSLHDQTRPWRCSRCNYYFQTTSALKSHETAKHDGGRKLGRFLCPFPFCKTRFPKQQSIYKHVISVHGKRNHIKPTGLPMSKDRMSYPLQYSQSKDKVDNFPLCTVVLTRCDQFQKKSHKIYKEVAIKNEPVSCDICWKTLASKETLAAHMIIHTDEKQFSCQQCTLSFRRHSQLQRHRQYHDRHRPWKCRRCSFYFLTQSSLKRHHLIAHRNKLKKRFHCDQCNSGYRNYRDLHIHMMNHDSTRPWKCSRCSLYFLTEQGLQVHKYWIHYIVKTNKTGNVKVKAKKMPFNSRSAKQYNWTRKSIHLPKLDDGRPNPSGSDGPHHIPTNVTDQLPAREINLEGTQLTSNEPVDQFQSKLVHPLPETIEENNEVKVDLEPITKLQSTIEPEPDEESTKPSAETPIIEGSKTSSDNDNADISSNKKTNSCTICSKILSTQRTLTSHYRTHEMEKRYHCAKCSAGFCNPESLKRHVLVKHEGVQKYECPTCGKRFGYQSNLRTHIYVHTGEKNYECRKCSKRFTRQDRLTKHLRAHENEELKLANRS